MNMRDDYEPELDDEYEGAVSCKHCGYGPLDWHHTGVRWVLLDDDSKIHDCRGTASIDEFEEIT